MVERGGPGEDAALRPFRLPGMHGEVRAPRHRFRAPTAPGTSYLGDIGPTGCWPTSASSKRSRTSSTSSTTTGRRRSTTTSAARRSCRGRRTTAGRPGIAFVWTKSLCGGDIGVGALNAAVAVHELIHGLGALQGVNRQRVRAPDDGHVCDSPTDVLFPSANSQTTISRQILDTGRNDYYGHSLGAFDVQDSGWLTQLPQQRLAVTIRTAGTRTGVVRLVSPTPFECAQPCTLDLDQGVAATLVAAPRRGPLRPLEGRVHGQRLVHRYARLGTQRDGRLRRRRSGSRRPSAARARSRALRAASRARVAAPRPLEPSRTSGCAPLRPPASALRAGRAAVAERARAS